MRNWVKEILYLDDGSDDGSLEIAKGVAESSEIPIKIISSEHVGRKSPRLNAQLEKINTDLIRVLEGDAKYDANHLERCIGHFADPQVAGVIGRIRPWVVENFWDRCRDFELGMRYQDYKPFTAWVLRTDVVKKLGGYDTNVWRFEDYFMGKKLLNAGYKIVFEKDAVWWHNEKTSPSELFWRRKEVGEGYWEMVFSKKWILIYIPLWTLAIISAPFYGFQYFGMATLGYISLFFLLTGLSGFKISKNPLLWFGVALMKFINHASSTIWFWYAPLGKFLRR